MKYVNLKFQYILRKFCFQWCFETTRAQGFLRFINLVPNSWASVSYIELGHGKKTRPFFGKTTLTNSLPVFLFLCTWCLLVTGKVLLRLYKIHSITSVSTMSSGYSKGLIFAMFVNLNFHFRHWWLNFWWGDFNLVFNNEGVAALTL